MKIDGESGRHVAFSVGWIPAEDSIDARIRREKSSWSEYHIRTPTDSFFDDLTDLSKLAGMGGITRIFGYGSLLNEASLRKTVPAAKNLYPAKVFGFRRIFNIASHYRFCPESNAPVCVLNVEETDPAFSLNGICFEMDATSFDALRSRERIYRMQEVKVHRYRDDGRSQTAKLFQAKEHDLFRFLRNSAAQKHYLNLCIQGCEVFGADFLNDFKNSTTFWGIDSEKVREQIWLGNY